MQQNIVWRPEVTDFNLNNFDKSPASQKPWIQSFFIQWMQQTEVLSKDRNNTLQYGCSYQVKNSLYQWGLQIKSETSQQKLKQITRRLNGVQQKCSIHKPLYFMVKTTLISRLWLKKADSKLASSSINNIFKGEIVGMSKGARSYSKGKGCNRVRLIADKGWT